MKILVAEDSPTVRRLVCTRLVADGYEVIEVHDGE
jgi:DNA-binding response OmpR family regulator